MKEEDKGKLGLWRSKNPKKNPEYPIYTFDPDKEGDGVSTAANTAIVELSLRRKYSADKRIVVDPHSPEAQRQQEIANDTLGWATNSGDWSTEPKPESKKKDVGTEADSNGMIPS